MAKKNDEVRYYGSRAVRPDNLKASKSGLRSQLESLRVNEHVDPSDFPAPAPAAPAESSEAEKASGPSQPKTR